MLEDAEAERLYERAGAMVGLEVHQQLDTGRKLFCGCRGAERGGAERGGAERGGAERGGAERGGAERGGAERGGAERGGAERGGAERGGAERGGAERGGAERGGAERGGGTFTRRLRASRSELGLYDPAAVFEEGKSSAITYRTSPGTSCLVEEDEEPPHAVDPAAKRAALLVAASLGARTFREIFPMRKMVIDGSNTSGFQRTMLVAQGGTLRAGGLAVGVQSVCLEEDAARLVADSGGRKEYSLDRLGIPLVEIALEPMRCGPGQTKQVALALGRLLRSTGLAARGIGTIRQDVNVSTRGGPVVEVKGVQQLDQLEKVVRFEVARQEGMRAVAAELGRRGATGEGSAASDVTGEMAGCGSKTVRKALESGSRVMAVLAPGFAGVFGLSPHGGVRLGREIAQLVRFYGVGGVFHSDELPAYGITAEDVGRVRRAIGAGDGDGFLLMALPPSKCGTVPGRVAERVRQAAAGVSAETRMATPDGETAFLRPRPGPARMYPETDVPPVPVSPGEMDEARAGVPRPWDEMIADLSARHGLNAQLAEQVLDSGHAGLLERVCGAGIRANFAASAICSTTAGLQRKGLDPDLLGGGMIEEAFGLLARGEIPKESVEMIFESIMAGESHTVADAVKKMSLGTIPEAELGERLDRIVADNAGMVERDGERALGPLMGAAMRELRGRAPGSAVNRMLAERVRRAGAAGKRDTGAAKDRGPAQK